MTSRIANTMTESQPENQLKSSNMKAPPSRQKVIPHKNMAPHKDKTTFDLC